MSTKRKQGNTAPPAFDQPLYCTCYDCERIHHAIGQWLALEHMKRLKKPANRPDRPTTRPKP